MYKSVHAVSALLTALSKYRYTYRVCVKCICTCYTSLHMFHALFFVHTVDVEKLESEYILDA